MFAGGMENDDLKMMKNDRLQWGEGSRGVDGKCTFKTLKYSSLLLFRDHIIGVSL